MIVAIEAAAVKPIAQGAGTLLQGEADLTPWCARVDA
jgi:hypothetical protein